MIPDEDLHHKMPGVAWGLGLTWGLGDVFDEQHEQDVVFVLTGVHAAAQFE